MATADTIIIDKALLERWAALLNKDGQGTKQTVKGEIKALLGLYEEEQDNGDVDKL